MDKKQYNLIAKNYSDLENAIKKHVFIPTFMKCAGNAENKKVIDLGCGHGYFTRILAQMKPSKIVGIDISEELIKIAKDIEDKNPLGIKYSAEDVLQLELNTGFDLVTAALLLDYATSKKELQRMCDVIYGLLNDDGSFCGLVPHPAMKPSECLEYEKYERMYVSAKNKTSFEDGDEIVLKIKQKNKNPFEFSFHIWAKETFEECFQKAGFKTIRWIEPIISEEGIGKFGNDYWRGFRENPSVIGLVCKRGQEGRLL